MNAHISLTVHPPPHNTHTNSAQVQVSIAFCLKGSQYQPHFDSNNNKKSKP